VIGFDTNVILRIVTGDDAKQQATALAYLRRHCSDTDPAFVNRIVAVELMWVLEGRNEFSRVRIAELFERLLHTVELCFEDHDTVQKALDDYRNGADFADAMIARRNQAARCSTTITFDKRASSKLPGFTLLSS
jgi:predicted nucleic-acid-binding protein